MNYDQIAARLQRAATADDLHALQLACDARRREIRAREEEIANPTGSMPPPPARAAAMAAGLGALAELDHEAESLAREFTALDRLEAQVIEKAERTAAEHARSSAGAARRKLPGAIRAVHHALEQLDAAIGALGATVAPLATVAGQRAEPFPLSDDELAALLELREAVWTRRDVPALIPADRETHPRAFAIFHEIRDDGFGERIIRRPPPSRTYLPDHVNDDSVR